MWLCFLAPNVNLIQRCLQSVTLESVLHCTTRGTRPEVNFRFRSLVCCISILIEVLVRQIFGISRSCSSAIRRQKSFFFVRFICILCQISRTKEDKRKYMTTIINPGESHLSFIVSRLVTLYVST